MSERSEVEQELMDASKFKSKNYPDRQDELAALVRACERMPDAAFDTLSEEAAAWYNKAATAMNDHDDIPEFEEAESDDEETSDDTDHEADEAAEDAAAEDDAEDDEDEDADDSDVNEGSIEEDEADEPELPKKKLSSKVSVESQTEDADWDNQHEEKTKPKGKTKKTSKISSVVGSNDEGEGEPAHTAKKGPGRPKKIKTAPVEDEPEGNEDGAETSEADDPDEDVTPVAKLKKPKAATNNKGRTRTPYDNLTGERDRFGLYYGTKTQQAAEFYARPEGATSKYVEMELAGRHRNILVRLAKDGHRVEKHDGGVFKLIHRDDLTKEVQKPKKAKK